jgi:hypothetical protein
MNRSLPPLPTRLLAALLVPLVLAGCVSSKFATVAHRGPNPVLELHGNQDPLRTTVDSVIVRHGPGSWKREAFWDEYVLSLSNTHRSTVRVLSLHLIDASGIRVEPGENCWQLEAESRRAWSREAMQQNIAIGAEAAVAGAGMVVAPVGMLAGSLAQYGLPLTGVGAGAIALPLIGESWQHASNAKQREIVDEFESRRIQLPATIAPGHTLKKSVFFRISPSPRQLVLAYEVAGEFRTVIIPLAPLAGYHANGGMNLEPIPTPITPLSLSSPI